MKDEMGHEYVGIYDCLKKLTQYYESPISSTYQLEQRRKELTVEVEKVACDKIVELLLALDSQSDQQELLWALMRSSKAAGIFELPESLRLKVLRKCIKLHTFPTSVALIEQAFSEGSAEVALYAALLLLRMPGHKLGESRKKQCYQALSHHNDIAHLESDIKNEVRSVLARMREKPIGKQSPQLISEAQASTQRHKKPSTGLPKQRKDDLVVGEKYFCKARGSVLLLQGFESSGDPILLVLAPGDLIVFPDRRMHLSLDTFLRHYEPYGRR